MSNKLSIFSSSEGRAKYMASYEAMFDLWPVSHKTIDVETRYGRTHINVSGPEDGPPLLFLHAAGFSSTVWYANIGALSQDHRTYAIDIIGDAGKSNITHRLQNWADHADWLVDVLDALALERAHVLGHSQGGWIAMALALAYPQRVNRLILLAPAASILPFIWPMRLLLFLAQRMIRPSAKSTLKAAAVKGTVFEERFVHMMEMVSKHCLPATMVPTTYSDDELRKITAPTLLLIGAKEKIYKPTAAVKRANQFMPNITAEIIPNASHVLIMEQPDIVNARILNFLEG